MVPLGDQDQVYDAYLAGKWISPMHPQIVRDDPGDCPICGMDLVSTEQYGYTTDPVPQPEVLVVPRSAVLMTGSTSLVYVETEQGRFEIRPIKLGPLLRNEAVILGGVAAGERVATSGNFLIDSQMQLAGKPSLIDPQRAIARTPVQEGPLTLEAAESQWIKGPTGEKLEQIYRVYAALVTRLAEDEVPTEAEVDAALGLAEQLANAADFPEPLRVIALQLAQDVAHLHHRPLEEAREQFKTVSGHILRLASAARGENAATELIHYYCGMVPSGSADWLQVTQPTANPYMGSKMLRCATYENLLTLPPPPMEQDDNQK